jgi:GxxExxY protein
LLVIRNLKLSLFMNESLIEEELTKKIIGAAIEVHRYWGPGLVESIYEKSLAVELEKRAIPFKRQLKLELNYQGVMLDENFRLDLIIGDKVVVELKVVKELAPIFDAQLLTYMRLTQCRVGLLMNFNVPVLKDGIKRLVL